jgi:hypothetical protein
MRFLRIESQALFRRHDETRMNNHPAHELHATPSPVTIAAACEQAMALVASGQHQTAWQYLQQLAQSHPQHAPIYRLQGGILQQAGQWEAALSAFRQALVLAPDDSQAHTGAARCLNQRGALPDSLVHYRAALRCQCQQQLTAATPPPPLPFDHHAAEGTLWQVLAQLAAAGAHTFATSGTLLGLVREGHLLPFDKDLDIGLPFGQMEAAACLQAAGWQPKVNINGLVNPQEWHGHGVALDLCGFLPDPASGKVMGGFWFESPAHPWSRVTEFPDLKLQQVDQPHGQVWQLADPETILVPLYGEHWRVPDPDFDTVVAAKNMRGFGLVTQCYAFARIYSTWVLGRLDKTRALVRHSLVHLPDDDLLLQAARVLGMPLTAAGETP